MKNPNPKTGSAGSVGWAEYFEPGSAVPCDSNWRVHSAAVAKERLLWCVKHDRVAVITAKTTISELFRLCAEKRHPT